jgi:hypothetical protein
MSIRSVSPTLAVVLLLAAAGTARAQQEWSFEGTQVFVSNIAGEITVRGHDGPRIVVRAQPGGSDAERLDFQVKEGGRAEFHVVYPLHETQRISYPRSGGGHTQFDVDSWIDASAFLREIYSEVSGGDRIEVGDRDGLEAWADLEILVPRGVPARVRLAVGRLEASDVEGDVDLDTHSGPVRATNIRGDTRIDTGSGSVNVNTVRGDLLVDTGSGSVDAADIEGSALTIDTGSGSITVDRARAREVKLDTGSGAVRTSQIDAESTLIDTGSGSVTLDLVRMGAGDHVIDTGSGSVTVNLPADASVTIIADTGSGGITLDVPSARLRKMSRDHVELEIGDGRARLAIDTGSGGIRIESR